MNTTAQDLKTWLTDRIAFYLEVPADTISPDVKLVEYGLESVYALALCGDVEDEFGIEVEPTLAWDHPTVDALAQLLEERLAGAPAA
ncbi:acyl carrier protein [Streptomyces sp. NRRL B-3229]|uniref:acyl carrier protein n=1 Tax=Streptomyces sp. NRRL B-3229 TaxID=1463836 RepID=UPI0004C1ECAA|nr:acyl carrier protein [Streptomyces sp. NRRL B-3229]